MKTSYYSLSITYNNQNYFAALIDCDTCKFELELSMYNYAKNQLNCVTIDDLTHNLETGYLFHIRKIKKEHYDKVKKYHGKYYDDGLDCAIIYRDFFNEEESEEYQKTLGIKFDKKLAKRIEKIVIPKNIREG